MLHTGRGQTSATTGQCQVIANIDTHSRKMHTSVMQHFETKHEMLRGIFKMSKGDGNSTKTQQMEGEALTVYQRSLLSVILLCGSQQRQEHTKSFFPLLALNIA